MSAEGWAIVGVIVGTVGTGTISLLQAALQRRWTKGDAQRTWEQARQDRLFEEKRAAHLSFLGASHDMRTFITAELYESDDSNKHGLRLLRLGNQLSHRLSGLEAYASADSVTSAREVSQTHVKWASFARKERPWLSTTEDSVNAESTDKSNAAKDAHRRYLKALRSDLGVEGGDVALDDLKGLPSLKADPELGPGGSP